MKRLKVSAKRIDEYEIMIDESVWNEAALKDWSSVFHQVDEVEEVIKDLAFQLMRQGSGNFFEGFGYVRTFYKDGNQMAQFKSGFKAVEDGDYCNGINVRLLVEDDEHEFEIEEVPA